MFSYTIRSAQKSDAEVLAGIFVELGHPIDADSILRRWHEWSIAGNSALVATQSDSRILGVATLHQMMVLHRPKPVGRITLMFVDAVARRSGVGRSLVTEAEAMLARAGCGLLEITSSFKWTEAHAFYEHLGYEKTGVRFAKELVTPIEDLQTD